MFQPAVDNESLATPLAEHFFIAGIESSCLKDQDVAYTKRSSHVEESFSTILKPQEYNHLNGAGLRPISPCSATFDKRQSIGSVMGLGHRASQTQNKRNSTLLDHISPLTAGSMSEEDFDAALRRFMADRDSVLQEIQEQPAQGDRPRVTYPSQKPTSPLSTHRRDKSLGSLKRRLSGMKPSIRSSNSTKRVSNRFSKRMSN